MDDIDGDFELMLLNATRGLCVCLVYSKLIVALSLNYINMFVDFY